MDMTINTSKGAVVLVDILASLGEFFSGNEADLILADTSIFLELSILLESDWLKLRYVSKSRSGVINEQITPTRTTEALQNAIGNAVKWLSYGEE